MKNAIVALFNLAKLRAELLCDPDGSPLRDDWARKITLSSRKGDPGESQASLFWDRIHAIAQPDEKFNRLLAVAQLLAEAAEEAAFGLADGGRSEAQFVGHVGRAAAEYGGAPEGVPGCLLDGGLYLRERPTEE